MKPSVANMTDKISANSGTEKATYANYLLISGYFVLPSYPGFNVSPIKWGPLFLRV